MYSVSATTDNHSQNIEEKTTMSDAGARRPEAEVEILHLLAPLSLSQGIFTSLKESPYSH